MDWATIILIACITIYYSLKRLFEHRERIAEIKAGIPRDEGSDDDE
jgi:hypothetical protein